MTRDVFVSHSSSDSRVALEICGLLEQHEITCWIAPRDVTPGRSYGEEIIDAITETRATVLLLSESSNASPHVRNEIERAVAKGKPIFPIRVRNVLPSKALELFVSSSTWVDAWEPPIEQKVGELARAISVVLKRDLPRDREHDGGTREDSTWPQKRATIPRIARRKWLIFVATVVLVGIGLLVLWRFHGRMPPSEPSQRTSATGSIEVSRDRQPPVAAGGATTTEEEIANGKTPDDATKRNADLAKAALTEYVQFWAHSIDTAPTEEEKSRTRLDFFHKFDDTSSLPPELKDGYVDYMLRERKYLTEQEYVVEVIKSGKDMSMAKAGIQWLKEEAFKEMGGTK
jgi:hypothetical protein